MDARTLARWQALGRVGFGIVLTARPREAGSGWIGPVAGRPAVRVLTAAVGARDLGLGLGTVRALSEGAGARTWVQAGVLADAADLVATVRSRSHLSPLVVGGVAALTAGSTALGLWLQRELP